MQLELRGVCVDIDTRPILSDIDLRIAPGELVALVGPNGSGKSTLLRTVYRTLRPNAGAVFLGGDDLRHLRPREAALRRSVLPQHGDAGTEFTAAEVVAMGRTPHLRSWQRPGDGDASIVGRCLERVGLSWAADRLVTTLSGGERQRVLLARALAQQAPLLVLDEPTNHLDIRSQLELLDLVRDLGLTLLAALHDLDHAAGLADRVVVLRDGAIVANGAPLETLTPSLIHEVFGVRAHVGPHPITGRPHIAVAI
ncbi:iron complex transport system ATP-binding protein [Catenulispora sp. GP43]|uniref:ABC transporter ATP-binding protein n=1 Tax=Catenulispora sp. GP43 TaxID=3156263 RepID=UPI0035170BBC